MFIVPENVSREIINEEGEDDDQIISPEVALKS